MLETNHAALGEGLKVYTDAMRRLIKERLIASYPNSWWESGVLGHLPEGQRNTIKRNLERDPSKDRLEHLDATHFVPIITKEFDHAFHGQFTEGGFSDFKKTQSWLQQVAVARNEWAHPRIGDILADQAAQALYAMAQLLAAARLPEAMEVERIRKDVLRIEATPAPPAAAPAPVSAPAHAPGHLPYWWEVCEPHDAFKNPATIDESAFAASLGGVHAGAARAEYLDPAIFFSHTYFTENLKQMIRDVASRLAGGEGPAVTEVQTPFGGGKTHALLALYHLVREPGRVLALPGVREALGDVAIPRGARVLVFDGQELGTDPVVKEDTTVLSTLWGELTYQVDPHLFRREMASPDERGEAPGNAIFRKVLAAASPCLILLDELVSYLVKLKFANTRRTQNLYRQTVQFLQELLQEVGAGSGKGVCVLMSLPKSMIEFGGLDPQQLQRELGVVEDLQVRSNRVVSKRTPVNDEEIYTLVRQRLFKKADPEVGRRVARAYREAYERTRALYDPTIFSSEYLEQGALAYPLHPELIDVLYKKWSTASDFPRTRAVLQLLASIVADHWVNRREAYAIQSAHVNLERERVRTRIVSAAGAGGGYDAVVAADIIGGDAHADMLDQRRGGDYERFHVARGVATTLLMHSFGGASRVGALPTELRVGTVAPNVGPEYVSEILESLEQTLWYVHREGERLRFQTRANIYRVIAETAESQPPAAVAERLRAALSAAMGAAEGFRPLEAAGADGGIADRPEAAVAVLDSRYGVAEEGGELAGRTAIEQLWEKAGGGLRQWRNALVLVAPDAELWRQAVAAMREVMAYEGVIAEAEKGNLRGRVEVTQQDLRELKSRSNDKRESLRTSIVTAYRWVFYPDEDGLTVLALPIPATRDERIVNRVVDRLSGQDYGQRKILRRMGALYFNSKVAPRLWKDETAPLDLGEASRRFPQWTFLPILPDRDETLRACIGDGLRDHLWAVAIGDVGNLKFQRLIERPEEMEPLLALFDGSAALVKAELLDLIREEIGGAVSAGGEAPTPGSVAAPPGPPVAGPRPLPPPGVIPAPPRRHARVRLTVGPTGIAKTSNLQPYLFRVLQEQDAGAEFVLSMEVTSSTGISEEALQRRIVEAFDQLGIRVEWEPVSVY